MKKKKRTTNEATPTWAVLVPVAADWLTAHARKLWESSFGEWEEEEDWPWEVIPCSGSHSALIDRRPGSEGTDEPVAKALSRELSGPVYLLRLRTDHEVIWRFDAGALSEELADEPVDFAERLGCRLPGARDVVQETVRCACVVEGGTPQAVAQAIGLGGPPAAGPLHIVKNSVGALVYSETGNIAVLAGELSTLPNTRYILCNRLSPPYFSCRVAQGDRERGVYEFPEKRDTASTQLESIKGETIPRRIATALDTPLELLRL